MKNNDGFLITERTVSLRELIAYAKRRWYIAVAVFVAAMIATAYYTFIYTTPMYTSTAKIYVKNGNGKFESSDMSISSYLANDLVEVINDNSLAKKVSEQIDRKYSAVFLKNNIKAERAENTRVVKIEVKMPSAQDAKMVADCVCEEAKLFCVELMGADNLNIISYGNLPVSPSTTSNLKRIEIGAAIGVVAAFIVILIMAVCDSKIASEEDVKRYLGLSVMAVIPDYKGKRK